MHALAEEIRERLNQAADPERKEWAKGNYPTALHVMGVKVPDLRIIVNDVKKRLRKSPAEEVIELANLLVAMDTLECQQVAYELLAGHKAALAAIQPEHLDSLGRVLDNWVMVDTFAGLIAGPAWRDGRIPDSVIHGWAHSEDRWRRRTAVVCTVALNQKARGGTGDVDRTLDICRLVAADRDEMVAKALSWALRELAKQEADPVVVFLDEYADVLPARVKREVRRKIDTGRK